jgi:hypothetical protein
MNESPPRNGRSEPRLRQAGITRMVCVALAGMACTACWVVSAERPGKSSQKATAQPSAKAAGQAQPAQSQAAKVPLRAGGRSSVNFPDEPAFAVDPCVVLPGHELVITDLSVVENERTLGLGPWSFGGLISQVCPADQNPSEFVENFFHTWMAATSANANDFLNIEGPKAPSLAAAEARTAGIQTFLQNWPRTTGGDLDLARAPLRLLAIVNRLDIHGGDAEEIQGRFVFCFLNPDGSPARGTLIMEYSLPPVGPNLEPQPVEWWAQQWHKLSSMEVGSRRYLEQLEFVTQRFSGRGVMPERPNGSALIQFRTGEQLACDRATQVGPVWEFRAFTLDPETGQLRVSLLNRTPHFDYNLYHCDESPTDKCIERLIDFLREHKEALLAAEYDEWFQQTDIELATSAPSGPFAHWLIKEPTPEGFTPAEWTAMHMKFFGGRTCNGCHVSSDVKIPPVDLQFLSHISRRNAGEEATLSLLLHHVIRTIRIPNARSLLCPNRTR